MRTCEAPVRRCVQSFTRWQKDPKVFRRTRYAGFRRKRRPDIIPLNLQDSGFTLRGSSASVAGASIARGCPPRTSPPRRRICGQKPAPTSSSQRPFCSERLQKRERRAGNERKPKTRRDPDDPRDPSGERRHHRQRNARREEPHRLHSLSQ